MNNKYFNIAIKEAEKAYKRNEVPVGCVIVKNDKIISKGYNQVEKRKCAMYHAELIAIKKATKKLNNWRLNNCDIYVTLKPCDMCKAIIKKSRIQNVYYILDRDKEENSNLNLKQINFEQDNYKKIIQTFFKNKRI